MTFLSDLNFFTQNRENRTRILLHGKLIHCFNGEQTTTELTNDAFRQTVDKTFRPVFFLASPYIHTFIHETIHLSKKEMEKADQRLLGFRLFASNFINVTSLEISDKKSVTIHSHLTNAGAELLKNLLREKIKFTWHPAVLSFITNLYQNRTEQLTAQEKLRIYLADEMLQIRKQGGILRFQHLPYLFRNPTFEEKRRTLERLIDNEENNHEFSSLVFSLHTPDNSESTKHLIDHIIITPRKGRHIKTIRRVLKKRPKVLQTLLKRNNLLGLAVTIIIVGAVLFNLYVESVNQKRMALKRSIAILQQQSDRLNQIAKAERDFFRFISLTQSAQSMKIQPALFLNNLDQILPDGVWVAKLNVLDHRIEMELLDSNEIELSAFMDRLGKQSGETNLKNNETITLNNIKIRKYSIEINHLKPQILYEKLD